MMNKLKYIGLMLALSFAAQADYTTNYWHTFTSATPEVGSPFALDRATIAGGVLQLGDNGNAAASASTLLSPLVGFGQSAEAYTNVVLKLDWAQLTTSVTTMTVTNSSGGTLFTLAVDAFGTLLWNGADFGAPTIGTGFSAIEINLNADDSVAVKVEDTEYGSGLAFQGSERNFTSITFSRGKERITAANFDNLLIQSDIQAIPEPAVITFVLLTAGAFLAVKRRLDS